MNSKYKVLKYNSEKFENIEDLISIEEPLEISIKFKEKDNWLTKILSITMRTPGDDLDLVRGFLFNVVHPPAGGNPIIVIIGSVSYEYLISPIIFGCIIILLLAILINKFILRKNYPLK